MPEQDDSVKCDACDGQGRIPFEGTPGAFYRDGEKYDPPGWEHCEACGGTGRS